MKVAIIGPQGLPVPPVKGGAIETLIDVILKENEKHQELQIDVYTVYDEEAIEASKKYPNVNFIFLLKHKKYTKIRNKFISLLRRISKLDVPYTYATGICRHLKNNSYAKVIIEGDSSLVIPIEKVIGKDKVLLHIHHNPLTTNHDEFRRDLSKCSKVIGVSDFVTNGIKECVQNEEFNCVTLRNCANLKRLEGINRDNPMKQIFEIKNDEIIILFSGRPLQMKGTKELLIAFKEIAPSYPKAKLMIAGSSGFGTGVKSSYEVQLEQISQDIEQQVIFTGFIPHENMHYIYQLADISVIPSLCEDAAPLVAIEAMASGLPLVVTNSGGIPEYVSDKCAIIINRQKDIVNELKKSLTTLIENRQLREEMSNCALIHSQQFTKDRFYQDFIKLVKY